ncbi:MAG: type II secretion system F family protein [Pirellulales bacterium]|nr:type II secretion system F family protein [Pirellulales bacterium]
MSTPAPTSGLWRSEADLAARLAELAKTGLPLPEGLKALAEEVPRRLRQPLRHLADCILRGEGVWDAVQGLSALPAPLGVMLQAGIAQGRLPEVLEQYARLERIQTEIQRRIRFSLAYPTLLMLLMTGLSFFINYFIVMQFRELYRGFGVHLPDITLFVFYTSRYLPWLFTAVTLTMIAIPLLIGGLRRVRSVAAVVYWLPIFGPLLTTLKMSQLTYWMKMFLEGGVPLPRALHFTAAGLHDGYFSPACRRIAAEVEQGRPLGDAAVRKLPATMIPILEWGQRTNALPEAFAAAAEMYESRAQLRGTLVESILSPLFLVLFLVIVTTWILGLLLPMISLITSLSSGGGG